MLEEFLVAVEQELLPASEAPNLRLDAREYVQDVLYPVPIKSRLKNTQSIVTYETPGVGPNGESSN